MEPGSIQHSGYLTPGDEINVRGGITVHFQKKQRRYWTLQYFGEGNLVLSGYKDEKSWKRSSSSTSTKTSNPMRQRKLSSAPIDTIRLMTSLKVHKFEMKTKKKVENALIIVSGSHPKFFRPDNKEELDKWHSVFKQFSSDDTPTKSIKRRERADRGRKSTPSNSSNRQGSYNLERDSGVSTTSITSLRESQRSSSSSMSSEELNDYSPRQIFPSTVFFDNEDDDHNSSSPTPSPTLREHSRGSTSLNYRRSIFIRNSEGIYEERHSPRESTTSTESGFYDTVLHCNDDNRPDSVYDYLPPSSSSPSSNSVHDDEQPVLQVKQSRASKQSSFDAPDSSIPEEDEGDQVDVAARLADSFGAESAAELQQILNDDGTNHPYINLKIGRTSSPAFDETTPPRLPERSPRLPPRRKTSLTIPMSDSEYQNQVLQHVIGSRRRAESMPIGCMSDPPPIPEKKQTCSQIEKLIDEQSQDQVEVHIKKEDLVDSIALVDIRGKVIIAGWSTGKINNLHVGDHLVQVNDQVVSQAEWANTFIKTSSKATIALHIHRLPYAKILNCIRIHEDTHWGLECKANEITHVHSGPAKEAGLTEKSESSEFSKKTCDWIITEAANKPIKLTCPKDEMTRFLATKDFELPLVVQPKDFISEVNKALNKLKRSSLYRVG